MKTCCKIVLIALGAAVLIGSVLKVKACCENRYLSDIDDDIFREIDGDIA